MKIKNLTKEQLINTFVKGDKETLKAYKEALINARVFNEGVTSDWLFSSSSKSDYVGCLGVDRFYSTDNFEFIKIFADREKTVIKELTLSDLTYKNKTKDVFTPCGFKMPWEAVKAFDEGIELFVNEDDKFVMIANPSDLFRFDPQEMRTKEVKEIEWYEDIPEGGVLCWVGDGHDLNTLRVVIGFDEDCTPSILDSVNQRWKYASPLTKAGIQNLLNNAPEG